MVGVVELGDVRERAPIEGPVGADEQLEARGSVVVGVEPVQLATETRAKGSARGLEGPLA